MRHTSFSDKGALAELNAAQSALADLTARTFGEGGMVDEIAASFRARFERERAADAARPVTLDSEERDEGREDDARMRRQGLIA